MFTAKLRERYRDSHLAHDLLHMSGTFVIMDELIVTHYYSKSIVYIMVILGVVHSMNLDKCII